MSTSPTAIPKVRTYAADLNAMRSTHTSTPAPRAVVQSTEPDQEAEKVIPPFHTFSKSEVTAPVQDTASTITAAEPKVPTSNTETQRILTATSSLKASGELKESMPAVIITDTKHKRFKLSEEIVSSMQNWWTNKKQTAEQKKIPKYTVPVAERRKGVIQKATVKTGRESSADHSAVLSRIKATKQIPHTAAATGVVGDTSPIIKPANQTWESSPAVATPSPKILVQNQRVVKRQSHTQDSIAPLVETKINPVPAWESDIQTKVNALSEPTDVKPSPVILTGQEFTKIKQTRAQEASRPVIVPEVNIPAPVARTIKPVIPPQVPQPAVRVQPSKAIESEVVRPIVPQAPLGLANNLSNAVIKVPPPLEVPPLNETVLPVPVSRPKISPIIPPSLTPISREVVAQAEVPTRVEQIAAAAFAPTEVPKPKERTFAPPRETKQSVFTVLAQTNHIVFITALILVFVVGSGLGLRAYLNTEASVVKPTALVDQTAFAGSSTFIETNIIENKNQLSERIRLPGSDADSLVEISFTGVLGNALTPGEFLTLFDASVPFDFVSSLNTITFGNYRGAPWILIKISDKNITLGGMLAWENSMGRNLSPIFGNSEATSYGRFTDDIINNADVRILKNESGTEEIVYGFIGYDSLLITSNTTAFLNLAQKIY